MLRHSSPEIEAMRLEKERNKRSVRRLLESRTEENDGADYLSPSTLQNGASLREQVKLPDNVPLEQWIYTNMMNFVEITSMLYDSVSDMCTKESCPEMSAGPHYSYYWTDFNGSNPVPMTAKQYINTLFQSINDLFESEPFNQCASGVFPESFMKTSRAIFKKLFRVYAHVYHNHLNEFTKLGAEAHLNTTFKHFILFDREFKMINIKEEVPLQKLIQRLLDDDDEASNYRDDPRAQLVRGMNSSSYRKNPPSDVSDD
ncbi:hypothetical protein BLSTO_00062 [Blastocystis sp. subtype 1]